MITKDMLRQVVAQQKDRPAPPHMVRREVLDHVLESFRDNRILILTGIRRSGKSVLLRQVMEEKSGWCYVNFEDERFIEFRAQDFEMLNEVLVEVYGTPSLYLFDEVQNIQQFEVFVRRLQDEGKKVVLTGSNASLLSRELGTRLTGRYKTFEVYPFSFREFLRFNKVEPGKAYTTTERVRLIKLFSLYLAGGGLPEFLQTGDREYVRTLYENVLYRDIIARYGIRRQRILRELAQMLATSVGSLFTYNALKIALGLSNAITVKEYLAALQNSYLFFELPRFDRSVRRQLAAPKKVYTIDSAIAQTAGLNVSENRGPLLENIVFLELKRQGREFFYSTGKNECDFVVKEGTRIREAIQVCYTLNDHNRRREFAGLEEAMQAYGLRSGLLLTMEQEEDLQRLGKKVVVMPVWKWLLKQ